MLTLINRFSKYSIAILGFLAITLSHAQDERAEDISILDVDASGEVDALTDGLLLLRSMFGLTDDALTTGVVSPDCVDCDATKISQYITSVEGKTYTDLNSTDDQNISGSSFDGTTLTIGIENGQSETVDLSSLEDNTGITTEQANAIEANTAKVGITADQAAAITANTAKVGTDNQNISGLELSGTTLTIGIDGGSSDSIDLAPLTSCSATQDGSRVIIACNDGTSGILASAGTVVSYPSGQTSIDASEFPTGEIVVIDGAGVILGRFSARFSENIYFYITRLNNIDEPELLAIIGNDYFAQGLQIYNAANMFVYYNETDCQGQAFIKGGLGYAYIDYVHSGPNGALLARSYSDSQGYTQILKSYTLGVRKETVETNTNCLNGEIVSYDAYPFFPYYPANEFLDAVSPVGITQLP
jgi:hypothetical protein